MCGRAAAENSNPRSEHWNSWHDQLFNFWNSTWPPVFPLELWNSVETFLHQLWHVTRDLYGVRRDRASRRVTRERP
jgi:hypothetical protein